MDPDQDGKLFVGRGTKPEYLTLALANRHGLAAGATGTGKTVTLQVLAEGFSRAGVSVFAADVKGDLSGIAAPGEAKEALVKRAKQMGFDYEPDRFPVVFWDLFGEQGHPVRATISEVGPILLSRMMSLNDVQEGVLNIAFRVADEHGLLLDDLKDLRSFLTFLTTAEGEKWATEYGRVSKPTVGTIQRQILVLENQGGTNFFSLPTIKFDDFMNTDKDGRGRINILAADKLMQNPRLYATFLLWLLSQLFQELPEVGDSPKPKLVFFFDEAHLLFTDAPKALLDQIEQVVRLIRSKGVGVYFVTQNPLDVPDKVLGQLGNRVQHALRAFTPRDQKAVRAAAETFRPNPELDTAKVIMELGKGEALVSFLEGNGVPTPVERALIRPPAARIGPLTEAERKAVLEASPVKGKYDKTIDRESAFEMLQKGLPQEGAAEEEKKAGEASQAGGGGFWAMLTTILAIIFGTNRKRGQRLTAGQAMARDITRTVSNRVAGRIAADIGKSLGGATGSQVGRAIVRGALGGMLRR
jgi:DNA helicase HerA-like ATPase